MFTFLPKLKSEHGCLFNSRHRFHIQFFMVFSENGNKFFIIFIKGEDILHMQCINFLHLHLSTTENNHYSVLKIKSFWHFRAVVRLPVKSYLTFPDKKSRQALPS